MEEGRKGSGRQATEKTNAGADLPSASSLRSVAIRAICPVAIRAIFGTDYKSAPSDILKPDACSL